MQLVGAEDDYEDVGMEFRTIFDYLLLTNSILLISTALKLIFYPYDKSLRRRKESSLCKGILLSFIFVGRLFSVLLLLVAIKIRLGHAGSVCSGDFLDKTDSQEGYLVQQGFFLRLVALILGSLVVSLLLCGCLEAYLIRRQQRLHNYLQEDLD